MKYDHRPTPCLHELLVVACVVEASDNFSRSRLILECLHDDLENGDRAIIRAVDAKQSAAADEVVLAADGAAWETAHEPVADRPNLLRRSMGGDQPHVSPPYAHARRPSVQYWTPLDWGGVAIDREAMNSQPSFSSGLGLARVLSLRRAGSSHFR